MFVNVKCSMLRHEELGAMETLNSVMFVVIEIMDITCCSIEVKLTISRSSWLALWTKKQFLCGAWSLSLSPLQLRGRIWGQLSVGLLQICVAVSMRWSRRKRSGWDDRCVDTYGVERWVVELMASIFYDYLWRSIFYDYLWFSKYKLLRVPATVASVDEMKESECSTEAISVCDLNFIGQPRGWIHDRHDPCTALEYKRQGILGELKLLFAEWYGQHANFCEMSYTSSFKRRRNSLKILKNS